LIALHLEVGDVTVHEIRCKEGNCARHLPRVRWGKPGKDKKRGKRSPCSQRSNPELGGLSASPFNRGVIDMSTVFSIIGWIVFGFIVGVLARFLVPGKQNMSWLMTAVLGIVGSFVGGGISWLIWGNPAGQYNPAGWIMSIVGAILVVVIYSRVAARGV
jgi:uncharacterized membrane protein YeaQ/YmgE (transglycosylase-associated protein family)